MGVITNLKDIKKLTAKDIVTDYEKLSERCEEIDTTKKNSSVQEVIIKMKQIMRSDSTVLGLSANQVGEKDRIICINFDGDIRTFINPIIENAKGLELSKETCHSIPGKTFIRLRHPDITVTYQTPLSKIQTVNFKGMAARLMQHHIDHLDGILLSDIGFEIDASWDAATDEERKEVIDYYLDSLDMSSNEILKDIADDKDAKQLADAIRFMDSVKKGETKIEKVPYTEEEMKAAIDAVKAYKEETERENE